MTGDPYWDNVVFLSGFEGGTIVDESPLAQTVTVAGSAATSTSEAKFGTQSLLPGATGCISVPDNASFGSGTTPFTCEAWVNWATSPPSPMQYIFGEYNFSSVGWALIYYPSLTQLTFQIERFTNGSSPVEVVSIGSFSPTIDTFTHIAVEYDGAGNYYIYVDGTPTSGASGFTRADSTGGFIVGAALNAGSAAQPTTAYLDEVRYTSGVARYGGSSFTPDTEAFPRAGVNDLDVTIDESVGVADATGPGVVLIEVLSQGVGVHHSQIWGWHGPLSEQLGTNYLIDVIRAQPALAIDDIGASAALVCHQGVVMLERLRIALSQVSNHYFQKSLSDDVSVAPGLATGMPVIVSEGVGVELTQTAQQAILVLEQLGLLPVIAPAFLYSRSLTETIGLADSLAKFFGADLSDTIGIEQTEVATAARLGSVSENIGFEAALTPQLILRVTSADEIGIDDVDALQMLFSPTLTENIELTAAYLSPGGGITTWAINTRSGAVTEYDNYAFNSFARIGNSYVGASSDGLYELLGDDDDGTDIVAQIKSGFAQWAGSRFTMFKGIYLGVRGEGDFVLKLETGDGKIYNYGVSTRDQRTTKVHLGKGLKARYWAFELISTGQDFDLDTIEFVPLVSDRRV